MKINIRKLFSLKLIDEIERVAAICGDIKWLSETWYYEQLAIIYRKEKRFSDEVAILERHQKISPVTGSKKLAARLTKARELMDKAKSS